MYDTYKNEISHTFIYSNMIHIRLSDGYLIKSKSVTVIGTQKNNCNYNVVTNSALLIAKAQRRHKHQLKLG